MVKDQMTWMGRSGMNQLSLRDKIGQLIATGFPATDITGDLKRLVEEYRVGNIILFSRNAESVAQLKALCGSLRRLIVTHTGLPPLISIDQEGGRVTRLPEEATNVPGAMAIASTGRPELAYAAGRITARELRALGINFNLAPVLDINNNRLNPVINVRSYGDTAETAEQYGLLMLQGLKDGGVLASVKHFPGHGDTSVDSHLGLPVIDKSPEQLAELELKPFAAAIARGAECITTAHILFPSLEPDRVPATMSRAIVTGLLKHKLGYNGLIISDCLEMDAIRNVYGTAEGAVGALKAGVHLLFISHTPQLVMEAVERIEQAVQSGELPLSVVDEAVEKVLYYKKKYGADAAPDLSVVGCEAHRRSAEAMSLESICHVGGTLTPLEKNAADTIFVGCSPYRTDMASSSVSPAFSFPEAMAEAFSAPFVLTGIDPGGDEIRQAVERAKGYKRVVIGLVNGREHPGQLELVERFRKEGHRVTVVALGKPYDLERLNKDVCAIAAFEYTPLAIKSLIRILGGEASPSGRISVALENGDVMQA